MKKNTATKKLGLNRETLQQLTNSEARRVAGGMEPESGCEACKPNHTLTCNACPDGTNLSPCYPG